MTLNHKIREICEFASYDWVDDTYVVRHEVLVKKVGYGVKQLGVDSLVRNAQDVAKAREIASDLLAEAIEQEGYTWEDVIPLPVPPGYKPPEWLADTVKAGVTGEVNA